MATDTEIENLLALYGMHRVPFTRTKGEELWLVRKGETEVTTWNFDDVIEYYEEALRKRGL